ncbi:hypothetical protein BBK36DRAFT_17130 [Trichoderma citrinoviride]|uniref:CCHC-type domain-containing protein n=1 Tax=Trichoderma citrinoviride TaxID=58853 RepID=A0A2T4BKD0_9HYPO|nr:hypothetical protein BBK36DRAFT_17130 [Trichoderma citrinoviride]PTB69760.1 hypothetical protein BBK36DRAFT_17130 [Trichoderma citrinoviride]
MTRHQPKPVDFISLLSSEDEAPLTRKRKYSEEEAASVGGKTATKRRVKRARASSASGDSVTRAKSFKEGKLEEDEGSDTGVPGFARHGEKKKVEKFTANTVFMPKSPPIFTIHPISLHLPVFAPQREGTWLTRFTEWAQLLCTANTNSPGAAEITPALIRAAYKQYIDIHSRLKSNKKRAARLVAQQFKDSSLLDIIRAFRPLQNEAAKLTDAAEEALEEALEETLADSTTRFDAPQPPALPPQTQILSAAAAPPSLLTEQSGALYIIDVSPQLPQTATTHETIPVPQPELLPALSRKPLRQTQHSSLKITMSSQSAIPSGAEALEQQRRYFPSATDPSNMCLLCGQEGHIAGKCTRSCRFCGEKGHWDYNCPSWSVRCADCWRSGHTQENCRYPNEPFWLVCGYCRAPEDHERWQCMTLFRSFRPGPDTIKKVNALPVSCAACGSEKHFHGDCRKDGAPNLPYHSKFHLDNMRQYLDPTSSSGPIIGTDACRPATKVGGFRISSRALASPVDNVQYYSGSDDSDDGLAIKKKMCKVANMYRVVKASKTVKAVGAAEANGVSEVTKLAKLDRDIKEVQLYTMCKVIKEAKMAQVNNRTAMKKEVTGSGDDVAKTVKMDTKEA